MMAEAADMRDKSKQIDEEMETKKIFVGQLVSALNQVCNSLSFTFF